MGASAYVPASEPRQPALVGGASRGSILVVAQDPAEWADVFACLTDKYDYNVFIAADGREALAHCAVVHLDLVIADQSGDSGREGVELLKQFRLSYPDAIRILVTGNDAEATRRAMSEAAVYQFSRKPLNSEQIGLLVERALETRELARRHRLLARELKFSGDPSIFCPIASPQAGNKQFEKLVYVSDKMAALCAQAKIAAKTDLPILILGETGTGKELLARAIHRHSLRSGSPLLVQNCGGMSDDLLQSELFGHKRGAFTGAVADRLGLFRAADGGTVFLDEISEVSPSFQVSLLRILQEGEIKPLGSDRTAYCNVRVIAACNKPLKPLVEKGAFRQDLYFRLKGFEFEVPPLRDRPDDIPALAAFFTAKHGQNAGRQCPGIAPCVIERLRAYDFPGNIRELENEIRRMTALAGDGEYISFSHMSPSLREAAAMGHVHASGHETDRETGHQSPEESLKQKVERLERQVVREALVRCHWNQSRASELLGLSRVGLANKIKRYGLDEGSGFASGR